jgi:hypothetical protein
LIAINGDRRKLKNEKRIQFPNRNNLFLDSGKSNLINGLFR